jgi:putative molybdopterin biosynthesis protein
MSDTDDRNIYLSTIAPEEAVRRAKNALDRAALIRQETVAAHESCGRVTSQPIFARCSSPTFHSAPWTASPCARPTPSPRGRAAP